MPLLPPVAPVGVIVVPTQTDELLKGVMSVGGPGRGLR